MFTTTTLPGIAVPVGDSSLVGSTQLLMMYLARAKNCTVMVIFLAMSGVALGVAG